jgi:hypothetical protein
MLVPRVIGIPTKPTQWFYDPAADALYLWLPDGTSPQANRSQLTIADWRPMMEEIVKYVRIDGSSTWHRLAHHRSHYTGWGTDPRANVDPTGAFVLFQSNWDGTLRNADGSPRTDVFLLLVPRRSGSGGSRTAD